MFRQLSSDGRLVSDTLALDHEEHPGEPVLRPVMRAGEVVMDDLNDLEGIRERARRSLDLLTPEQRLADQAAITPEPSAELLRLLDKCKAEWGRPDRSSSRRGPP